MTDPFTAEARLCDDDGIVRKGLMHHGTDYPCTGHAHFAGEHYRCSSPAHPGNLPGPLLDVLMDPTIELPGEAKVKQLVDRKHLLSIMAECDELNAEVRRLREALRSIEIYAGDGPHQSLGEACGIDACTGCLIHGTAVAALSRESQA